MNLKFIGKMYKYQFTVYDKKVKNILCKSTDEISDLRPFLTEALIEYVAQETVSGRLTATSLEDANAVCKVKRSINSEYQRN